MTASAPGAAQTFRWRRRSVLPGFGLSLGYVSVYLSLVVLIPLAGLAFSSASLGWTEFWRIATDPRVAQALWLSFTGHHWHPTALKIGIGRVNAISGKRWHERLNKAANQDYVDTLTS